MEHYIKANPNSTLALLNAKIYVLYNTGFHGILKSSTNKGIITDPAAFVTRPENFAIESWKTGAVLPGQKKCFLDFFWQVSSLLVKILMKLRIDPVGSCCLIVLLSLLWLTLLHIKDLAIPAIVAYILNWELLVYTCDNFSCFANII